MTDCHNIMPDSGAGGWRTSAGGRVLTGGGHMGRLYETIQSIDRVIARQGLDPFATKGAIGLKAGFFLVTIRSDAPDDPLKIAALKEAAEEILGEPV